MRYPRRVRWLRGRYANVDGIPYEMPVEARDSPALFAAFSIDPDRARDVLPGQELHPCRVWSRGVLVLAVVSYQDTPIGQYVEFCVGVLCTRGRRPAPPLLPLLARRAFGTGVYIHDLPVSTEISVKGGLGIWGMPKRQANLDFVVGEDTVSSQYDLDGACAMRIDVPRPKQARLPFRASGVGYGDFRGMLTKSYVHLQGRAGLPWKQRRRTRLLVGEHPRMDPIRRLDIDPEPLFTAFAPRTEGMLDDHVETWFLTAEAPPPPPTVGLADAADLGLGREWLAPPDRERTDRLLAERSPNEAVGTPAREGQRR